MSNNAMEGGKAATKGGTGGYNNKYDPRDSPSKKGGKSHGKGKKDEKGSPNFGPEQGSRSPGNSAGNSMEGKPLPPWRRQQGGSPQTGPVRDDTVEASSPPKSGGYAARPRTSPKFSPSQPKFSPNTFSPSQDSKFQFLLEEDAVADLDLPPIAVSFKAIHGKGKDPSSTKESRTPANKDDHSSPDKDNNGDNQVEKKNRVRDEIQEEVMALLENNDTLCRNDFDGKSRQFLHAIHNIGGRQGVHDALKVLDLCTKKSRNEYRNMSGYVTTLLQKHFQEIGGKQKKNDNGDNGKGDKDNDKAKDEETKEKPKVVGPPAALAGSLTSSPISFGPSRPRAKA
jgi:hypothetical protein